MNNSCFLSLCLGLFLLPFLSIHSQQTTEYFKPLNLEFSKLNMGSSLAKSKDDNKENVMKSNRFFVSADGNFQHFKPNAQQSIQKEKISGMVGYFLNEKTMLGLSIQFSQEEDFFNIIDGFNIGTVTNTINKRKFQPFVRRYLYSKNSFNIFSDLSFQVASEEFSQSFSLYGSVNNNPGTNFQYMTVGAHLGLGVEYNLNDHWVVYSLWEALRYQKELNIEESNSDNIILEDLTDMSVFRDLRIGLGYYF